MNSIGMTKTIKRILVAAAIIVLCASGCRLACIVAADDQAATDRPQEDIMAWTPTEGDATPENVTQLLADSSIAQEDGSINYALLRTQTVYCKQATVFLKNADMAYLLTAVLQSAYPKTRLTTLQQVSIQRMGKDFEVRLQAQCHLTNKGVRLLLGGIDTLRIRIKLAATVDDRGEVSVGGIAVSSPDVTCREYMLQLGCRIVFGTEDYKTFVKEFVSQTLLHLGRIGLPEKLGADGVTDQGVHLVLHPYPVDQHAFAPQTSGIGI